MVSILPRPSITSDGFTVTFRMGFTPGQSPTVTQPERGPVVLKYDYAGSGSASAGLNGIDGQMELKSSFSMTIEFSGNKVTITQRIILWMFLKRMSTQNAGNVVDKTITDAYTIGINAKGGLEAALKTDTKDNSIAVTTNDFENFFTNFNVISNYTKEFANKFVSGLFQSFPITTIQNYVFPGGKTFTFKQAAFSDNQDLTALITYVDPLAH